MYIYVYICISPPVLVQEASAAAHDLLSGVASHGLGGPMAPSKPSGPVCRGVRSASASPLPRLCLASASPLPRLCLASASACQAARPRLELIRDGNDRVVLESASDGLRQALSSSYIYIYIYREREREIYIYIYIYTLMCIYIYIYIYILIIIIIIIIIIVIIMYTYKYVYIYIYIYTHTSKHA